jgi:hypothetical protein|uniref:hypothetical protein n=1 Tax=Cephaloticoccus sp. TaxID=1985742 RepID=UPI00404A5F9E
MATEPEIKTSLVNLLAGIIQSDGAVIAREMANLDAFLEQGRMQLHPQLVHFLGNRSYAKALMYLGGESDIPVGICGGNAKRPAQ